jgi:UDP-hydrolysing UDP-N-acetyl-D-glucosamine 2-epimerase
MRSVKAHPDLTLQLVLGASALLDRHGRVERLIREDGFVPDYTFHNIVEGETPVTMAKSTGLGMIEMAMVLDNLKSDYVVIVGDRFEMMAVALAAAYMNIRVVHTMGGEVTGTIDESIRHAITKFAHIHFPANPDAEQRIVKMGEDPETVFCVGCPRIDLVAEELENDSTKVLENIFEEYGGVGAKPEGWQNGFLLVSQHPVTTEYGNAREQIEKTLEALHRLKMPTIMLWPNIDAGSDDVSTGIRTFRERYQPEWLHLFKNLPIHVYVHLMNTTSCLVGNSSSGVREGAFIGTPVVNIGSRQQRRERGANVIDVGYDADEIYNAIATQCEHGKYDSLPLYGDGTAGDKIADIIAMCEPPIQKVSQY